MNIQKPFSLVGTVVLVSALSAPATLAETRSEGTASLLASLQTYKVDKKPTVKPEQAIGNKLYNSKGEVIGRVETVVAAPDNKTYAVVDTEFKGAAEFEKDTIAMPMHTLIMDRKQKRLETTLSRSELIAQPEYDAIAYVEVDVKVGNDEEAE